MDRSMTFSDLTLELQRTVETPPAHPLHSTNLTVSSFQNPSIEGHRLGIMKELPTEILHLIVMRVRSRPKQLQARKADQHS